MKYIIKVCPNCKKGNKLEFGKIPFNVSFDYKCSCGAFNKIKLTENDKVVEEDIINKNK